MPARRPPPPRRTSPQWRAPALLCGAVLACVAAVAPAAAQAPATRAAPATRIGYIDMKRLLDNSPQIVAGRQALTAEFAERDSALKAQEQRLADMQAQYQREAAILPPDVAKARATEIETLERNLRRLRDKMREDLNARSAEETNRAWARIQDTVIEYAREQGYDLVVQSPVIYASATIDITDDVLARLRRDTPPAGGRTP